MLLLYTIQNDVILGLLCIFYCSFFLKYIKIEEMYTSKQLAKTDRTAFKK